MSSKPKEDEPKKDPREAVDRSCRGPVLFLAFSAVAWLLVYSLVALLAGVKVHATGMMADSAWLAYGRIQPASVGVAVWFSRSDWLGRLSLDS